MELDRVTGVEELSITSSSALLWVSLISLRLPMDLVVEERRKLGFLDLIFFCLRKTSSK